MRHQALAAFTAIQTAPITRKLLPPALKRCEPHSQWMDVERLARLVDIEKLFKLVACGVLSRSCRLHDSRFQLYGCSL